VLARGGAEVTCIASEESAAAIAEQGLSITSNRVGSFRTRVRAVSRLSAPLDVLCIAVKATDLADALDRVPPEILGDAIVVPFLNGIEHVALIRERLAKARIVPATIRIESTRTAPGEIVQASPFAVIELATTVSEEPIVASFAALLSRAGLDVTVRDDEYAILWEKLSFLAPLALLTTIYGVPAGIVRSTHREELIAVINEVAKVAQAEGVAIDVDKVLTLFDGLPGTTQSSMQRDAQAGRPMEIEAIGGAVVRSANAHSISLAIVPQLVDQLRTQAKVQGPQ
jgi:2-dehydropantoate 2-reductase